MTIDNLKKGVEFWEKYSFVRKCIESIDEDVCIILGSQDRLDKYIDIQERVKNAIKAELLNAQAEINIEIEKL